MAKKTGSGFVGLDNFLKYNQAGAARMAADLGGRIGTNGADAERELGALTGRFQGRVEDATLNYDPTGLTSGRAALLGNKTYTGPLSVTDDQGWNEASIAADKAGQQARMASNVYGRQGLLADTYGKRGGYTAGAQGLDSFLAGAAGGNRFAQLKSQYGGLSDMYSRAASNSTDMANNAIRTTEQAQKKYQEAAPLLQGQEAAAEATAKADKAEEQQRQWEEQRDKPKGRASDRQWDYTMPGRKGRGAREGLGGF
jgi:hypothetical protein